MKALCFLAMLAIVAPAVAADLQTASLAVNQLGLDLLPRAGASTENALLSPYSIQVALAMTYAGAGGATRAEMSRVLHFPADDATLHASFAALAQALADSVAQQHQRNEQSRKYGEPSDDIELRVANRLFGQRGFEFRAPFLDVLKTTYAAPLETLNFRRDPEAARRHINSWVETQTAQKIIDLIPDGGLTEYTRLVLTNALYFKAPWGQPFDRSSTAELPFHIRDVAPQDVPTMRKQFSLPYAKHDGFTAVALPYAGRDLQFLILLPDASDGLAALEKEITPELLAGCATMSPQLVALELPKFKLQPPTLPLGQTLQALGLRTAFDQPRGSANFDRMAPRKPDDYLFIGDVFHKTFLALDEEGTEAAAATAVAMLTLSAVEQGSPPKPIVVRVDHPFLFAIQHCGSGACLFLGRVTDPR
jgi:serpin B